MPSFISVAKYAKKYGVSTQSVYARIKRKTLRTKETVIKSVRIYVADVKPKS